MPGLHPTLIQAQFFEGGTRKLALFRVPQVLPICGLTINDLDKCFSNFNAHTIHLGILWKCQFGCKRSRAGLRFSISNRFLGDACAAGPMDHTLSSKILKNGKLFWKQGSYRYHLCSHQIPRTLPGRYQFWINVGWMDEMMDGPIFPQTIDLLLSIFKHQKWGQVEGGRGRYRLATQESFI